MSVWTKGILSIMVAASVGFGWNYVWTKSNHYTGRLYESSTLTAEAEGAHGLSLRTDKKGEAAPFKVYAKQKLYRYAQPTFTASQRVQVYPQEAKAHAPVFTVVGKARSSNGVARYKLNDGTYITADQQYVQAVGE
ncbi:DUF5776 domain-containing protein [Levilactobacillus lanxiensis]|uniref:DUF5776 domain-containing protein n=1 Tax=Levilactobacillus lanxiensis TaxID=2799568 RepID=A0ABW4D306_9LACO|nr:DUF5776 domain-containing protein [Levilactobacillus lanxiensis]